MNKVIYIKAQFKPVGKVKTVKIPTGEKTTGMFGGEKEVTKKEKRFEQSGWSDCEIDGELLAKDISDAVDDLSNEGYEIVAIQDIISGNYNWQTRTGAAGQGGYGFGYGYGYSYTEGVTIVAKKSAAGI
ncbi:hypothetical protein [Thalassospira lucentensis]|uniref:hypothetical protein n=1 Tax=Thalassospira lucentensis TaxID=168935 RepID=UPI003AA7B8B2